MSLFAALSDVELLDLMKSGHRSAFAEIYARYWKKLFAVAANKTGQPEEAEEIVQEIFVSLWQRRESIEINTTLSAYLAVSVKYRVLKILAKRYQYQKYAGAFHYSSNRNNSTEEWVEFSELKSRLEVLIANLPEKCRLIYRLSREEGFSQKQIAEEYGIAEKTVEAHISRALKALRRGLGQVLL